MPRRSRSLQHELYTKRRTGARSLKPALKQIRNIKDEETRNYIRGIVSQHRDEDIKLRDLNTVRGHAKGTDLRIAAELLLGKEGVFPTPKTGATYRTLITKYDFEQIDALSEALFIAGHLNGWRELTCAIITAMTEFASIVDTDPADAISALYIFADHYGASNYVARKIAYITSIYGEGKQLQPYLSKLADKMEQHKTASPYFLSLELLDCDFPYFMGVSTRIQIYNKFIDTDFRQVFALNELAPTPINRADIGGFLRRSLKNSIVDEIQSVIVLLNLGDHWPDIKASLDDNLCEEIKYAISNFRSKKFNVNKLFENVDSASADFFFYRRSLAFVEFSECSEYRFLVDRIVVPRLISKAKKSDQYEYFGKAESSKDLTKSIFGFTRHDDYKRTQNCGTFLRTVQFLAFLNCKKYPTINHQFIRAIFEKTQSLDILLSEDELNQLYERCDDISRPIISVLALALHKAKRHDEDVDFVFRYSLAEVVRNNYNNNISDFVGWLLPTTPQIAHYLVSILDRTTLQKLYWLIRTADQADVVRKELLRLVGRHRNEIRYYVEADAIEAGRQVAKLKRYFDDSRIYVDGIAFKNWLTENPNSYSQQYVKIIERSYDLLTARTIQLENGNYKLSDAFDISALASYDYILLEAARIAYSQFCTNRNFGIESYLGRRIRHNTLSGMLRSGVEDLIENSDYFPLRVDKVFMAANNHWTQNYRSLVEELRKDTLQFQTEQRPRGVFKSTLADDDNTRTNIANLRNMISKTRTPELFNELLIKFCWQELDPQLRVITRAISGDYLKRANEIVESSIGHYDGVLYRQYRSQVRDAIHERFTRLASWFRQPEDGFVPATTKQLADLIIMEAGFPGHNEAGDFSFIGEGLNLILDGLSVHRVYDCLFVLITNAIKYGFSESPIIVEACRDHVLSDLFSIMTIRVTSSLSNDNSRSIHLSRLKESFQSMDIGAAMVVEGYSGLKKMRYILQHSEGRDTVKYKIAEDSCTIQFTLTVEIAKAREVSE